MSELSFNIRFNKGVRERAAAMLDAGLTKMVSMGVIRTRNLFLKSKYKLKYRDNEADLIQLIMPRYGFVQMSQGGLGSKVYMEAGKRRLRGGTERPFMFDAADEGVEPLADWVAEMHADRQVELVDFGRSVVRR